MSEDVRRDGSRSLTRLGAWLLCGNVTLVALGLLRGDVWLYLVALLAVSAVTVSWLIVPRLPHIESGLQLATTEVVGQPTPARLVLRAGVVPVPRHHLTLHVDGDAVPVEAVVAALAPGQVRAVPVVLRPAVRGRHDGRTTVAWTSAPFGLVRRTHIDRHALLRTVAAGIHDGRVGPAASSADGGGTSIRVGRSGPDVHALRAWAPGDGTAVHWRATARRGAPVVVDRESPERLSLVVVIGPAGGSAGADRTDATIALAAGVALRAAREGADVRLVTAAGAESLGAEEARELLSWTAAAQPVAATPENADEAVRLAGPGGRVVVVTGQPALVWTHAGETYGVDVVILTAAAATTEPASPPAAAPVPSHRLLVATLCSLAAGLAAMASTGVVPVGEAVGWGVCIAVAGVSVDRRPTVLASAHLRTALTLLIVAITGAFAVALNNHGDLAPAAGTAVAGLALAAMVSQRTRRDVLVALGLGPVMGVSAAGLAPGPELALPLVLVAVAVLAGLAAASEDSLHDGVAPTAGTTDAHLRRPLAGPVTAVIGAGLVAFLVLPLGAAPTLGTSLLGARNHPQTALEAAAELMPDYVSGMLDLGARGHLPHTPTFEVPAGSPPLWRAMTLDTVASGVWSSQVTQQVIEAGTRSRVPLPVSPADLGAPSRPARDYDVLPIESGSIIAPGPPQAVRGIDRIGHWQTDGFDIAGPLTPYTVTATPREDVDSLTRAGTGPDRAESRWVAADPDTTARTDALARSVVAGTTDRVAAVQAVQAWLRANVRYQLDAPLPPRGEDPVDFLLFSSRAGFCEHFAAAEVTLLRSLGIPSRIATGYSVGSAREDTPGRLTVLASDAHAWVEVWIPGHGWVTSDPTAGSTLADPSTDQGLLQRAGAAWTMAWSTDGSRRGLAAIVLLLVALVAGGSVALRRRRATATTTGRTSAARAATTEPLAAFGRFRAALSADGLGSADSPRPGDGVHDVRRRVAGDVLLDDAQLLGALDVVERVLYDRAAPPTQVRLGAADVLDRHTAALLARAPVATR